MKNSELKSLIRKSKYVFVEVAVIDDMIPAKISKTEVLGLLSERDSNEETWNVIRDFGGVEDAILLTN